MGAGSRESRAAGGERMRALDLFAGACGGWSLGLHRAGIPTVAACEIDPWRRAVYGRNNPGVRLYDDVRTLTADRLVRDLGFLPDVVVGSPPCQDASSANAKGKGVDGERTGLFFDAIRLVGECRPVWACFENSPGIRTRGVDRVLAGLEALDYAVWPVVVGAGDLGANHRRKRVWFVAADADFARLEVREGKRGHAFAEQPSAQRDIRADDRNPDGHGRQRCERWRLGSDLSDPQGAVVEPRPSPWAEGLPDLALVDDGPPLDVALYSAVVSAQGDTIIPEIAEAIARTMLRLLPEREAA